MKKLINLVFLGLSIALSTYFMIFLTANIYVRVALVVFVFALEIAMQYILAMGKVKFKTNKILGLILFFCYFLYIIVYNIPSGIGFFLVEIDQSVMIENTNIVKLNQLNNTIDILNQQLDYESQTGYGERSQKIMDELEKYRNEVNNLSVAEDKPNPFSSLAKVFGLEYNHLAAIIFSISVLLMCIILIITSWELEEEKKDSDLVKYINHVIRESGRLNSNKVVAQATGLNIDDCERYRNWLLKLKINGKYAVEVKQGGSSLNVPKEEILEHIN